MYIKTSDHSTVPLSVRVPVSIGVRARGWGVVATSGRARQYFSGHRYFFVQKTTAKYEEKYFYSLLNRKRIRPNFAQQDEVPEIRAFFTIGWASRAKQC